MEMTDDGAWTWGPFWDEHNKLVEDYNDLVKRWNRNIPIINAGLMDVGRPLAASGAQVRTVTKLHKAGKSLRWIVDDTNLSLRTVRTIVEKSEGTDRTTKRRRQRVERIEIDKFTRSHEKRVRRTIDAVPKQVQAVIEAGQSLVKEAKGLGRKR
jgi:hypothetical protein